MEKTTLADNTSASGRPPANSRHLFAAASVAIAVFGMVIALLGTLFGLPEMRERLAINMARQGDLFSILFAGLLLSTAVVGPTIDRYGSKLVLVCGSAMVTAALLLFAVAHGFLVASAAALLLGIGGGWLNTGSNALVSDVYPDDRGRMLNLLGIFFGVGALFVPFLVTVGFGRLSIGGVILVCAAVAAVGTALGAPLSFPAPHEGASFSFGGMLRSARDPSVLLFALLLFFQSGNEASLSGWTSTYIYSVGWSPRAATIILLGYWVVAIAGRALSARAQAWVGKGRLVVFGGAVSLAGCLVLLAGAGWLPVLALGAWLTSLGFSAIFPTTLAMAGDRYHRFAGTVFGLLFTVGNFGSIGFPWALGHISEAAGVRYGMLVPLAGTVCVTACALWVAGGQSRQERA
jgi:MFS family permease